ncbi:MAG: AraC family transcriptional regulator, partial [Oscillospiraceae bacterium]|nr:AraC family transcriptional regulator [Oscillospiraceae bacterium]
MALSEPVRAVSRMQAYIAAHLGEPIRMADLSRAAGYSPYHAARLFKKELGQTPFAYIRALRLTKAAEILRDSGGTVTDAAEHSGFDSHDGFTRAFTRQFAITPQKYRRETPSVHWFVPHPIEAYYYLKEGGESMPKEPIQRTMTVTAVERPARKLILKR